jgi:hypothetical protein
VEQQHAQTVSCTASYQLEEGMAAEPFWAKQWKV